MTQHHDAMQARRYRRIVLEVFLSLLGLVAVGLPEGRAQVSYSGGIRVRHQSRPEIPTAQPPPPQPVIPKTALSYFPDNDFANPSYYPGGEPRPLQSPVVQLLSLVAASDLPWNQPGYQDYNVPPQIPRGSSLGQPKRYILASTLLPQAPLADRPETALLIARLPEHAALWVEGTRTRSNGRTRYFQSPPLVPGRKYNYRLTAAWIEDGSWVSQTRMVPVQAGLIQAIYLRPEPRSARTSPEQKLSPELAKELLLKMMRSKAGQDLDWFHGDVPDEMAKIKFVEASDGGYDWGTVHFNPTKASYKIVIAPKSGIRVCIFEYEGSFVTKDGAWSATMPKLVSAALQPAK